ncbi:hypothetical protein SeMB42_g01481 [Synchytrium endobioticum]|uniref:Vacuolar membrane protein n=1 Tax=Synchytrium endobioticum TaxID=286115 RepID=A0A507DKX0_9FUNG|nr:hypothetical protein SeMB42_g01481 [Synchytrium endobioticum]
MDNERSRCCNGSDWKRDDIPEHKFDFVDVDEFADPDLWRRLCYASVFLLTLKSILVYMADIGVVVALFITGSFATAISNNNNVGCSSGGSGLTSCVNGGIATKLIPLQYRVWIILATVLLSFILLYIDVRRANVILASRDISYAVTSTIAYRYYSLKSYSHYCLFNQISNSKKGTDALAFFVFFSLKGWKRLLLAEFPRQLINGLNLYDILVANVPANHSVNPLASFFQVVSSIIARPDKVEVAGLLLTTFSVSVWIISFTSLVIAGIIYLPLACVIQGNLKEYCCKKIDKRVGELLRKMSRKRVERARRIAMMEAEERAKLNVFVDPNSPKRAAPPVGLGIGPTLPSLDVDLNKPLKFEAFIRNSLINGNREFFPEASYEYKNQEPYYSPIPTAIPVPLSAREPLKSGKASYKYSPPPPVPPTAYPTAQNSRPLHSQSSQHSQHSDGNSSSARTRSSPRRTPNGGSQFSQPSPHLRPPPAWQSQYSNNR